VNILFLETPEACQTAAATLRARKARSLSDLEAIENRHQQNLIDFILGTLTDSDLDQFAAERQRLEILAREDHSAVLEAIAKRQEILRLAQIRTANLLAAYNRRVEFAKTYNEILTGTKGFNIDQVKKLSEIRPGSIPGDQWWRFTEHRAEYGCLPENTRLPYGAFCKVPLYQPEPLED
jgi:hypothetical protein